MNVCNSKRFLSKVLRLNSSIFLKNGIGKNKVFLLDPDPDFSWNKEFLFLAQILVQPRPGVAVDSADR